MALKHTNPNKPRFDKKDRVDVWAVAPYNFVPLPEKMVEAQPPLDHDRYFPEPMGVTGWIECDLETCSPTYIRGMLKEKEFASFGQAGPDQLTEDQKKEMANFFGVVENVPLIPGSSLRGMIRQIMEIVGHGRIRYVSPTPTFTYRAVAAQADDPLRDPYREVVGAFARNVRAGILQKRDDEWWIQPSALPSSLGLSEKGAFLKIKERDIPAKTIPELHPLSSPDYRPLYHPVSFDVEDRRGQRGRYTAVTRIGSRGHNYQHKGVLICSGNMMETGNRTNRKNHALILLPDERARAIQIDRQAIEDYRNGLTPYQEELTAWGGQGWGCLKVGAPVFYVPEGNTVRYFGHSPNFRIPARLNVSGPTRAANPRDFVPDHLRNKSQPDLVDAIFGWVEDTEDGKVIGPKAQRAGRVFFSDARFVEAAGDIWLKDDPITLHVLSGPKPTTFQHYLVQDGKAGQNGHHPDNKVSLAHYGTPLGETQIRGHKLYWHKGDKPDIEATTVETQHPKQLTQIKPIQPGVKFRFKVHFENLRPEELGLLWWALALPGESDKQYRHKIGMGKPLGLGSVAITPQLFVSDRKARYQTLFGGAIWEEAVERADAQPYIEAMNRYLLQEKELGPKLESITELARIRALLVMLTWREGTSEWQAKTRYMEIEREHGSKKVNEYKERPVLPDPFGVIGEKLKAVSSKEKGSKQVDSSTHTQSPTQAKVAASPQLNTPEIRERVLGMVDVIEPNGDVYLLPEKMNYKKWLLHIPYDRTEGIHYQIGQKRACVVIQIFPDDNIVECKPAPKKRK